MSGRIFENRCDKIKANIAPKIQQEIIGKILAKYPDIEYLQIGSVGKKKDDDYNGDIDIAIKCKDIDELENIITNIFEDINLVKIESLYIVSIEYPYNDNNEIKYVQCDFMIMWDKEYTAFRYYCPDYRNDESKYKVGAKIMFSHMLLNHVKEVQDNFKRGLYTQFDFRPTALYKYEYTDFNNVNEIFVTNDVQKIVDMCFNDGDKSHFNSVETIWEGIHSDKYKYPEEVKIIERNWFINCWKKGWTSIVPEDFKLQYWTNEEIWKYINKQKFFNKLNQIAQMGREI